MGQVKEPSEAIPFVGLIYPDDLPVEDLLGCLEENFGMIIKKTMPIPFTHTKYYSVEMGENLMRQWIAFEDTVLPDELVEMKHWTNELEEKSLNEHGGRVVNIDPGIISMNNLVLASTKNYTHRIYLGNGIYAELTLIYKDNRFQPLEWTYPDYREEAALRFFYEVRQWLKNKLRAIESD